MKHIKSIIVSSIITLFSLSFISCGKMDTSDSHIARENNTELEVWFDYDGLTKTV